MSFLINFCFRKSIMCGKNYIYYNNLTEESFRYERIVLAMVGEILLFLGFAFINGSVIYRLKHKNLWE